jgi:hypothetical protein
MHSKTGSLLPRRQVQLARVRYGLCARSIAREESESTRTTQRLGVSFTDTV